MNPQVFLDQLIAVLYQQTRRPESERAQGPAHIRLQLTQGVVRLPVFDHPRAVAQVARDSDRFHKEFGFLTLLGANRINTNGDDWRARRDLTKPLYLAAARPECRAGIRACYENMLAARSRSDTHPLSEQFTRASLQVFHNALGVDLQNMDRLIAILDAVNEQLVTLQYAEWTPVVGDTLQKARNDCRALLQQLDDCIAGEPKLQQLCQHFSQTMAADARCTIKFRASEELLMNMLAAFETTVSTLLWSSVMLARHPQTQTRLRALMDSDDAALDRFINETLRCYPAIPFVVRRLREPIRIDNHQLMAGQTIIISIVGVHRHPEYWRNPHEFDPARAEFTEERYDKYAFIPFFQGERMCGGARLARLELREGLRALLRNYHLEPAATDHDYHYGLALRPAVHSLPRLTPLDNAASRDTHSAQ